MVSRLIWCADCADKGDGNKTGAFGRRCLRVARDICDALRGAKLAVELDRGGMWFVGIDTREATVVFVVVVFYSGDGEKVGACNPSIDGDVECVLIVVVVGGAFESDSYRCLGTSRATAKGWGSGCEGQGDREGEDGRSEGLHYEYVVV